MQIVRDARIKKTIDNKGNLYGDPFMAVAELTVGRDVIRTIWYYDTRMKGTNAISPRDDVDAYGDEENSR